MAITSLDIQNQSFSINRKGYDVDEVDVFLEHVADEIDGLNGQISNLESQLDADRFSGFDEPAQIEDEPLDETQAFDALSFDDEIVEEDPALIADLKAQIAALQKQVDEKSANDTAISQALIVAQRSADNLIAEAKEEAAQIIADADAEAERIVSKAESERDKIQDAIRNLEEERESVRVGYRDMLNDFMDDAERKLTAIDADARKSAHAAHSAAPAAPQAVEAPANQAYQMPVVPMAQPAAEAPVPGYQGKDFSGYGDADDDFDFNDVD